jgi:hypothetical protein
MQPWLWSILFAAGCGQTPAAMSPDCLEAIDRMNKAVAAKDLDAVDRAEQQLEQLAAEKKFPSDARHRLQAIGDAARAERWQEAADLLAKFPKPTAPASR